MCPESFILMVKLFEIINDEKLNEIKGKKV